MRAARLDLAVGVVAAAAAALAAAPTPDRPPPLTDIVAQVRPSVVEVIGSLEATKDNSYGTGFAVSAPDLVVTNAHVLRGARNLMVRTWEGALLASVEVIHVDDDIDLAALRVKGLRSAPLVLSDGPPPAVGQRVVAVGHPRGYEFTVSDGIVSASRSLNPGGPELIQTTAPISPGSSGGPLLDLSGRVVGVCSLTLTEGQNINFAIPARAVRPFLAEALEVERSLAANEPGRLPPDSLARLVRKHRESGDLRSASDLAHKALAVHPRNLSLLLEAAETAWDRASYREAESLVAEMLRVSPGYAPARQIRAALLAQDGRCEQAAPEAAAALKSGLAGTQAAEAHALLGECLGRAGQVEEALAHLDQALLSEKVAAVPDYHVLRAFLLQSAGRVDEADRESVVALDVSDWDPLVVGALRERGLPRLIEVESHQVVRTGGGAVVRGVVRNRGPVALAEITLTAEARDPAGVVVATGTVKAAPATLTPGQTGAFRVPLEEVPTSAVEFTVRVVDYREP